MHLLDLALKQGAPLSPSLSSAGWATLSSSSLIIPDRDHDCWLHFVEGCKLICGKMISNQDLKLADDHLLEFCREFEHLYGSSYCTMDMHLHLHLISSVLGQ